MLFVFDRAENIVGKGEYAGYVKDNGFENIVGYMGNAGNKTISSFYNNFFTPSKKNILASIKLSKCKI